MSIESLIDALDSGDSAAAQDAFNTQIGIKLQSALDAKKIEVASSMVGQGNEEPEAEE